MGEAGFGLINGVIATKSGWLDGMEVVEFDFDPRIVSFETVLRKALEIDCAKRVFARTEKQLATARRIGGMEAALSRGSVRRDKETKYYLLATPFRFVPMTELQAVRLNARPSASAAASLLTTAQLRLAATIEAHPGAGWKNAVGEEIVPAWRAAEAVAASCLDPGGRVVFDFESGTLEDWQVVEGRFDCLVCPRETFHNDPDVPYNKEGRFFLSTLETEGGGVSDPMTGVIMSPVFTIEGPTISFLVGGGRHADTGVILCTLDGTRKLEAHGTNSEEMQRVEWDVSPLEGQEAYILVVDRNKGPWGHVTMDDFRAEGKIAGGATADRMIHYGILRKNEEAERKRREKERQVRETGIRLRHAQKLPGMREDPALTARGERRVYRGESLESISLPLGGIGAGTIQINGRAERAIWQIFNNFEGVRIPDSFFAVRAAVPGREPVIRTVQTTPEGPFPPMENLTFSGEYPFAWYRFEDADLPVSIRLEAFTPLLPLDVRNSAIPCAIFNLTAENPLSSDVEVSFLATQQNAVNVVAAAPVTSRRSSGFGNNRNRVRPVRGGTVLHLFAEGRDQSPAMGDMALAALADGASGTASWTDRISLFHDFSVDGALEGEPDAGPSAPGETINGALAVPFRLGPGEKRTVSFILTWHFPFARHGGPGNWIHEGNMYANWWDDAAHVAAYLLDNVDELEGGTRLYHRTFYESNLPRWLLDRISSQVAVLRSRTCFWDRENHFGAWEGCSPGSGCCHGSCTHVWHYAQAHARLFPEIARLMREATFAYQKKDGALPHRHPAYPPAFDGQCGDILGAWREHLQSSDGRWLRSIWPSVKKAVDHTITAWDSDEDGVLAGPQHNTLDVSLGGSTSWLGTLYLAALEAGARMADLQGDGPAAARYRRIRSSGAARQNATLWNGEYYIQIRDPEPRHDYGDGCHIDQVLGEWWANQVGIEPAYPADRVRSALRSLIRYNFKPDFHGIIQKPRQFVDPFDAGMQMITWPRGERPVPTILYGDEVMTGFEYAAAATMVQYGLLNDGFMVVKAIHDRYDGRLRTGLTSAGTASWGYSGNPFGDDECGKFYARAMSVWSVLLASQGYFHNGPAGIIGFKPKWRPGDHRSFFTAAEGWGLFTQKVEQGLQLAALDLRFGRLRIRDLVLAPAGDTDLVDVAVRVDGEAVKAKASINEGELVVRFENDLVVNAGQVLHVGIRWDQDR